MRPFKPWYRVEINHRTAPCPNVVTLAKCHHAFLDDRGRACPCVEATNIGFLANPKMWVMANGNRAMTTTPAKKLLKLREADFLRFKERCAELEIQTEVTYNRDERLVTLALLHSPQGQEDEPC